MKQRSLQYRWRRFIGKGLFGLALIFLGAAPASAQTLNFLSTLNIPGTFKTDVWGYVDPNDGTEYAVLGDASGAGITIVDVSDPATPVQVGNLSTVPGFDVKVWGHYVYTVTGGGGGQGGIVDISDPANPQVVGGFPSSHNIFIADNGYLYAEAPGLKVYDLNPDPLNPALVWQDNDNGGHDATVIGNRLYDFHGTFGTRIYDVTDPADPQLLATINDPAISYHHSGWTSEDGNYLYICDELANHPQADITIWDISNLENPEKVGEYADANAIVHNLYITGNYAYVAYYTAGIRVFDISDPTQLVLVDEYDTSPANTGEFFAGAFGIYPYAPSGNIYANDWDYGLFVFSFDSGTSVTPGENELPAGFELRQNYPNPFNPSTTIAYRVGENSTVNLRVYNLLGQPVRTLVNQVQSPGDYRISWNGRDDAGRALPSGVYFYQLKAGGFGKIKKMLLVE